VLEGSILQIVLFSISIEIETFSFQLNKFTKYALIFATQLQKFGKKTGTQTGDLWYQPNLGPD